MSTLSTDVLTTKAGKDASNLDAFQTLALNKVLRNIKKINDRYNLSDRAIVNTTEMSKTDIEHLKLSLEVISKTMESL